MEAAPSTETNGPATEKTRISWKTKYLALKAKCDQMNQVRSHAPSRDSATPPTACIMQANDVLYSKSRQIYKMIQRAEAEKRYISHTNSMQEVPFCVCFAES